MFLLTLLLLVLQVNIKLCKLNGGGGGYRDCKRQDKDVQYPLLCTVCSMHIKINENGCHNYVNP